LQNAELFTLTYGALVVQLIKVRLGVPHLHHLTVQDYEDYAEVNKQLEKMCDSLPDGAESES
jgi:hypothetical protein